MKTSAEARSWVLFVVFLLALAGAGLAWTLVDASRLATYEIRSRDAVSGLIPGAPVEFHGVEVGRVRAVELDGPRHVRVLLAVRRDVPVTSRTVATITGRGLATRGFTGYVYVALEEAGDGGQPLAAALGSAYPRIASAPAQITAMDTAVAQLNQNVQATTAMLQAALDPQTLAAMKRSLAGIEQVTQALAASNERMLRVLANAERASDQVQPLLRSSGEVVQALRTQVLPQAQQALAGLEGVTTSVNARMDAILRNTEQASTRVGPLLQSSNEAVRSLQSEILPEAQRTLTRLDRLSSSLGQSADRIRRNPSLLLRSAPPAPDGPGEGP